MNDSEDESQLSTIARDDEDDSVAKMKAAEEALEAKQKVRHRLRKDHGIEGGIPVVFSLEKPKAKLLPFRGPSGEEYNPSDYQWGNSSNILKQNLK
ncbi:uncharacterized protein LOC105798462 isoform X3 [Gossypium raimondii]|uniref:uncharacterized protein LOC105798462 isoform X3 n=1 Tax=Gossypium raimondii TaxID=29730 RepID=UPI00227C79C7|nr:uncharacterized protein LOC105798462 isoform X3 [Gossypium raimondii]